MFSSLSGIFSGISNKFSQTLILSALTPTAIFVIVAVLVLGPYFPGVPELLHPLAALQNGWQFLSISLMIVTLSLLVYMLNSPIVRFFEGYMWAGTNLGCERKRYHQSRQERIQREWKWLRAVRAGMNAITRSMENLQDYEALQEQIALDWEQAISGQAWEIVLEEDCLLDEDPSHSWNKFYARIQRRWIQREVAMNQIYPKQSGLVLPTRLGNILRSAEEYPNLQYKIDWVAFWPRLVGVIDAKYLDSIQENRIAMLFFLNSALLSGLAAFLVMVAGVWTLVPLISLGCLVLWLGELLVFTICSYLAYLAAVFHASRYGDSVRGAYDLFRNELLAKLGYDYTFTTREEETALWNEISNQVIYARPASGAAPNYRQAPPAVIITEPEGIDLHIHRGWLEINQSNRKKVMIQIHHAGKVNTPVTAINLRESVPPDWMYAWGTALASAGNLEVIGKEMLDLRLVGLKLETGAPVTIEYELIPARAPD